MAQLEDGNFYAAAPVAEEANDVSVFTGGQHQRDMLREPVMRVQA